MISTVGRGASYAMRGAGLVLGKPALWPLVIAPFLLSLTAMGGLVWVAIAYRGDLLGWLTPGGWLGDVLGPVLTALYWLLVPIVVFFLYLPVASLIAGPFNEAIAEKVEAIVLGKEGEPFSPARLLRDLGLTVVHELKKFLRWALLAGSVFACSVLLPGLGAIIGTIGGAYIAARFAAWDSLDYTLSRRGFSYEQKQRFLRERRSLCLGLGGSVAGLLLVPVVNALALPFGAAGGALLVHDELG